MRATSPRPYPGPVLRLQIPQKASPGEQAGPFKHNPSWSERHLFPGYEQLVVGNVFDQFLDSALEKGAKPVQILGFGTESAPVDHAGQGDTVNAGALGDFANHHPSPFREFLPGNQLFDFKPQHMGYVGFSIGTDATRSRRHALALLMTGVICIRVYPH